ncbi:hypothetical protein PTI98_008779 [Pleurotus ostreatus]|nr:hypothetical protein PTI98_008779 [Pleurotus ostreatus]
MTVCYVEDSLWSRVYSGNRSHLLANESVLLTHVALAGDQASERSYVEVHYTDDSGNKCVCHFGALEGGKVILSQSSTQPTDERQTEHIQVYLPFFAYNQYTISISGSADICFAGSKLVVDSDEPAVRGGPGQWPKYVGVGELSDPTQTTPLNEEEGCSEEEDEESHEEEVKEIEEVSEEEDEETEEEDEETEEEDDEVPAHGGQSTPMRSKPSSPVKTLAVPVKLETVQPSQTRKKAPTSKPKVDRAESTSSPVKTLAATVKLETPRAQTKAPTSNPPTMIPESPNPKKRAVANADLPESPKRHKKEQAKEGHADAPTHKDEQEGTGLVIQHGDEVDVRYVLSVQNQDGTYTIRREAITLTTVKIGDEAALFGVSRYLEGMRGGGVRKLFIPSGVLETKGKRSRKVWMLKVRASTASTLVINHLS